MNAPIQRSLFLRILLPFAAGYFLSYLYRTVNAVLGPVIAGELALPDNALGLLTSTYFLAFGAAQLPLGMLLDRYGPRRVEASLLIIAALGAAVFALAAAKPLEMALGFSGWREILIGLAVVTLIVALALWYFVPDKTIERSGTGFAEQLAGVRAIFASRHFWRYAPMGFCFTGGFMAIQGLWASRWMNVMESLDAAAVAARLTWMGSAMLGGFLFMGFFASALVHRGISLEKLFRTAMFAAFLAFAVICLQPQWAGDWLWPLLGACFSLSNIAYSLVAQAFPSHLSGRANTALNLLVFAGAFGLQWGIGILVDALQANGWHVTSAYPAAFYGLLGAQLLSLIWFLLPRRQS